jgi:hypothetical protein
MRDKAVGRIAILSVLGLCLFWISGSSTASAATTASQGTSAGTQKPITIHPTARRQVRSIRRGTRHAARSTKQKTQVASQAAPQASDKQASDKTDVAADKEKQSGKPQGNVFTMPASVANANAQFIETAPDTAQNQQAAPDQQSAAPNEQAAPYMVAADQINDIDLAATGLPAPKLMTVTMENRDDTDLTQTSVIGRIFIAIGGLLTIGSAVRMFIV